MLQPHILSMIHISDTMGDIILTNKELGMIGLALLFSFASLMLPKSHG